MVNYVGVAEPVVRIKVLIRVLRHVVVDHHCALEAVGGGGVVTDVAEGDVEAGAAVFAFAGHAGRSVEQLGADCDRRVRPYGRDAVHVRLTEGPLTDDCASRWQ